jgi:hypothetical protein
LAGEEASIPLLAHRPRADARVRVRPERVLAELEAGARAWRGGGAPPIDAKPLRSLSVDLWDLAWTDAPGAVAVVEPEAGTTARIGFKTDEAHRSFDRGQVQLHAD